MNEFFMIAGFAGLLLAMYAGWWLVTHRRPGQTVLISGIYTRPDGAEYHLLRGKTAPATSKGSTGRSWTFRPLKSLGLVE